MSGGGGGGGGGVVKRSHSNIRAFFVPHPLSHCRPVPIILLLYCTFALMTCKCLFVGSECPCEVTCHCVLDPIVLYCLDVGCGGALITKGITHVH